MNGLFQNHLIVCVMKSPLNYFLPDSTRQWFITPTLQYWKKIKLNIWCLPCNFISFNAKEMEICSYIKLNDKWGVKRPKFGISGFQMVDFRLVSYLKLTGVSYWQPTPLPQLLSVISLPSGNKHWENMLT